MTLCSNRPEGFSPQSHLYTHIPTSCFLDTVLVPLCTWLYLSAIVALAALRWLRTHGKNGLSSTLAWERHAPSKQTTEVKAEAVSEAGQKGRRKRTAIVGRVLYTLLILAQILMCVLEIARLSLAHLGVGLLPFTFVTLITAFTIRLARGFQPRISGWRWANLAVGVALAVIGAVKVAGEVKEGTSARERSKYPMADQITDVSVMIGLYAALATLELCLPP